MLGGTFRYVGTTAGALGYQIKDVAIAGLMANTGIKAESAGIALWNILTNMANPTSNMYVAMKTFGVTLGYDEGNMYSLLEVLENLRAGFVGGQMDSQEFADSLSAIQEAFEAGEMSEDDYENALTALTASMYGAEGAQKAQLVVMLAGKYGMAGLLSIVNANGGGFSESN